MRRLAVVVITASLLVLPSSALRATPPLPAPDQVFTIAMKPQAKQLPVFFTPETLLAALPRMKPAYSLAPLGGKIATQSGVIVLKDGSALFWRSYRRDLIVVETARDPILYMME